MVKATEGLVQHHLYASRDFVLRMTDFRKFEVQFFVGSSVLKPCLRIAEKRQTV